MFDDFELDRIDLGDVVVRVRHGGNGPPVLLLHGHPRTHTTWHRVAPLLGREFTVVCPELDHPEAVTHLAVLDAIPIGDALARTNAQFAQSWPHWFFFGLPEKPERAILCDPDAWYGGDAVAMGRDNFEDCRRDHTRCTPSRTAERNILWPDRLPRLVSKELTRWFGHLTLLIFGHLIRSTLISGHLIRAGT